MTVRALPKPIRDETPSSDPNSTPFQHHHGCQRDGGARYCERALTDGNVGAPLTSGEVSQRTSNLRGDLVTTQTR